jgi:hypothetical protein
VALESINKVTQNINTQRDVVELLTDRKSMIMTEFDTYVQSMKQAIELIHYFDSSEMSYFKDSFTLTEELKAALRVAVGECQAYMEGNLKKLLDSTSSGSSKKQTKRVRELLTVLDHATGGGEEFKRLLKTYVDARRGNQRFKTILNAQSSDVSFSSS